MKKVVIYLLCVALLSTFLALAACSPPPTPSSARTAASAAQLQATNGPAPATSEIQPAITPPATSVSTEAAGNLVAHP